MPSRAFAQGWEAEKSNIRSAEKQNNEVHFLISMDSPEVNQDKAKWHLFSEFNVWEGGQKAFNLNQAS